MRCVSASTQQQTDARADSITRPSVRAVLTIAVATIIAACAGPAPRQQPASRPAPQSPSLPMPTSPPSVPPPPDISSIPDVVPKAEPKSARGNPPFYTVLGKRYFVLDSAAG